MNTPAAARLSSPSPAPSTPARNGREGGPARVLLSSLRNEAPFLLEWVIYHRLIGFDRIVIAHNGCTDGSEELLAVLEARGWVTAIANPVSPDEAPQQVAAERLLTSGALQDGDWAIWLDLDEFLNIHTGDHSLSALIAAMGPAQALLIPWRLFGDAGETGYPERFLDPAFTRAALPEADENRTIKTLFRFGPHIAALDIHRPTLAADSGWRPEDALTASGRPIDPGHVQHQRWLAGERTRNYTRMAEADFGWELAQINHYSVRSRGWFDLKRERGRGYTAAKAARRRPRHTETLYETLNRNEAEDRSILVWADAVTAEIDRARKDPGIAAALALIEEKGPRNRHLRAEPRSAPAIMPPPGAEGGEKMAKSTYGSEETNPSEPPGEDARAITPAYDPAFRPQMFFPDEVRDEVQRRYRAARHIVEYGSGGSTIFAASETTAHITSVESDRDWAGTLAGHLHHNNLMRPGVDLLWADIGQTKRWGRPANSRSWHRYSDYPLLPWTEIAKAGEETPAPDLVLVDGRFRVGCFVASVLQCRAPLTLLFDDYMGRPTYHRVEQIVPRTGSVGRMAVFDVTPRSFTNDEISQMIPWFFTTD